jgi:hypothetical protein
LFAQVVHLRMWVRQKPIKLSSWPKERFRVVKNLETWRAWC